MIQQGRVSAGPDYADLHRHVGGAVHPKVLYGYLTTYGPDAGATPTEREVIQRLLYRFPTYADLKEHFATRRSTIIWNCTSWLSLCRHPPRWVISCTASCAVPVFSNRHRCWNCASRRTC